MKIVVPLLLVLALSACGTTHELAKCSGPAIAMNPTEWKPAPADLVCPEDGQ